MKKIVFILLIIKFGQLSAQNIEQVTEPIIKNYGIQITDFIPKDWILIDSVGGDLNKDKYKDYAIVIESENGIYDEDSLHETKPRILLILFWNKQKNRFQLKVRNDSFIMSFESDFMDDPFGGVGIKNGVLEISFHLFYSAGSWWVTDHLYKFRYQNNEFELIGYDAYAFHRATSETRSCSANFLTRKYNISTGEGDELKTEWKTIESENKIKLDSLFDLYIGIDW